MIMAGPGIPSGRRIATPVSTIDIVPTVLARVGLDSAGGIEGRRSLRLGRFKLIKDENEGTHVLHDLAADPEERTDLSMREPGMTGQLLRMIEDRELGTRNSSDEVIGLDLEERERLRALGYVP